MLFGIDRAYADDGHESTGLGTLLAVGEKEIRSAGCAEVADKDVLRAQTRGSQLGAVRFLEVEEEAPGRWLVAGGHHVEPLDGVGLVTGAEFVKKVRCLRKLRLKLDGDFGTDLVAAATDRGSDGGKQISWARLEMHLKLANGFDDDAG